MEIERKFLVKKCPENLTSYASKAFEQGYLNQDPVLRIRKEENDYFLTYKSKGLLKREEINMPLNKEAYSHLKTKIDGPLIQKTRFFIPLDAGLMAELDIFSGYLEGLTLVEVEFETEEMALNFIPPVWFEKEVTYDPSYQNNRLTEIHSKEALEKVLL